MITWNYRVFRESNNEYIIREVFYHDDGSILGCSADAVEPYGQSLDELARTLDDFQAALTLPVLTEADLPQSGEPVQVEARRATVRHEDIRSVLGLVETPVPTPKKPKSPRRRTA
jgi:hypothetical protein